MEFNSNMLLKKAIIVSLFLIVVASIFYYSWLPYSNLRTESYLPRWILNWSNEYINLRTAVPFVALGYLLEVWIRLSKDFNLKKHSSFQLKTIGIAALIVCLAEAGQFFIEDRHPDFMDIVFGIAGSLVGVFLCGLIRVLIRL